MEPKITIVEAGAEAGSKRVRVEMVMTSEIRGKYPDLTLPADIDTKALGEDVQFVTLPLGQVDAKSRNDRTYPRKVVEKLMKQINDQRPEGNWGHIPTDQIGTAYPQPAIRWLVADMDENGIVWGKGLPLTPESDNYYRKAKATGAKVGTSLMAWAELDGEEVTDLDLITVDMADPARVGIPMTAAKPVLSSEMQPGAEPVVTPPTDPQPATEQAKPNDQSSTEETNTMDPKDQEIAELTAKTATLKSENTTLEAQLRTLKPVQEDHHDLRELLGVADGADLVKTVKALKEQRDELAAEATRLLAETMTAIIGDKVKLEGVRPIVTDLVKAQKPITRKQLDAAIESVLASESVKVLLQVKLQETMGDKQRRPLTPGSHDDSWKQFAHIPERK